MLGNHFIRVKTQPIVYCFSIVFFTEKWYYLHIKFIFEENPNA